MRKKWKKKGKIINKNEWKKRSKERIQEENWIFRGIKQQCDDRKQKKEMKKWRKSRKNDRKYGKEEIRRERRK